MTILRKKIEKVKKKAKLRNLVAFNEKHVKKVKMIQEANKLKIQSIFVKKTKIIPKKPWPILCQHRLNISL